jgi:hypothetical protein
MGRLSEFKTAPIDVPLGLFVIGASSAIENDMQLQIHSAKKRNKENNKCIYGIVKVTRLEDVKLAFLVTIILKFELNCRVYKTIF